MELLLRDTRGFIAFLSALWAAGEIFKRACKGCTAVFAHVMNDRHYSCDFCDALLYLIV
jgi:hypothetical protein